MVGIDGMKKQGGSKKITIQQVSLSEGQRVGQDEFGALANVFSWSAATTRAGREESAAIVVGPLQLPRNTKVGQIFP